MMAEHGLPDAEEAPAADAALVDATSKPRVNEVEKPDQLLKAKKGNNSNRKHTNEITFGVTTMALPIAPEQMDTRLPWRF